MDRADVDIEHLGTEVNTPYSEFGALKIDDTLWYSSLRFETIVDKSKPPVIFSRLLKQSNDSTSAFESMPSVPNMEAHIAINSKKDRYYYTVCQYINASDIRCKLYYRTLNKGVWSEPVALPDFINLDTATSTQPTLGIDPGSQTEVLYFTSDRPGGKGGLDIWSSIIESDGTFQSPVNVSEINTFYDEITPFYHRPTMITHKNITRLVSSDNIIDLNSYNKCLSTGSISFDASTYEIWGMLLNGGLLAITEQHELLDQNKIEKIIDNLSINIMWFTSSWFNNLIESGSSIFLKLELIIVGGEQLSIDHIKLARKKNPQLRIVNCYGATECTTFSAFYEFSKELAEIKNVPIGKPIANTYMYVLNNEPNLQPIGVIGDIYIECSWCN